MGPVEYVLIGFPGNQFTGEIVPALADLVEQGTIRIIDLAFVRKDENGDVTAFELDTAPEATDPGYADLDGEAGGVLNDEDLTLAAESLAPDSAAALLVWEDLWASPLAEAIRNAGGQILAGERIPHEIVEAATADL
jgi:hypothetical protein